MSATVITILIGLLIMMSMDIVFPFKQKLRQKLDNLFYIRFRFKNSRYNIIL